MHIRKKMKKNIIFFAKNLVISKKCSTFALAFLKRPHFSRELSAEELSIPGAIV